MQERRYKSGLVVRTFPVPPQDFDVSAAPREALEAYGLIRFPSAPDFEESLAQHLRARTLIKPHIRRQRSRRRKFGAPVLKQSNALIAERGNEQRQTWAGGVIFPPDGSTFAMVEGAWQMPNVNLPPNAQMGVPYIASLWAGMDGTDGSDDVLQAGCDISILSNGGPPGVAFRPWFEWVPLGLVPIPNIPVSAGDILSCLIRLGPSSKSEAVILFRNVTKNINVTPIQISAENGTTLSGNCAEWILESPQIGYLPNFGVAAFQQCSAVSSSNVTVGILGGNTIDMTDFRSNIICQAAFTGPNSVNITYV